MSFFSGLYLYQIVMLVAGTLPFIVILILLVILTATGKEIGKLFLFFALSIVMIGFPAYRKIEISKDGVKLERTPSNYFGIQLTRRCATGYPPRRLEPAPISDTIHAVVFGSHRLISGVRWFTE
jgi:hypothetical protein